MDELVISILKLSKLNKKNINIRVNKKLLGKIIILYYIDKCLLVLI